MSRDISLEICLKSTVLTDTGENVQKYFRLGAESYSSLGRVGKKKKKIACSLLDVFACGDVSSRRLYRLKIFLRTKNRRMMKNILRTASKAKNKSYFLFLTKNLSTLYIILLPYYLISDQYRHTGIWSMIWISRTLILLDRHFCVLWFFVVKAHVICISQLKRNWRRVFTA